jgi:hypothetical protein
MLTQPLAVAAGIFASSIPNAIARLIVGANRAGGDNAERTRAVIGWSLVLTESSPKSTVGIVTTGLITAAMLNFNQRFGVSCARGVAPNATPARTLPRSLRLISIHILRIGIGVSRWRRLPTGRPSRKSPATGVTSLRALCQKAPDSGAF